MKSFYNDRVKVEPEAKLGASILYAVYQRWSYDHGHKPMSNSQFKEVFENTFGHVQKRLSEGLFWIGIKL